MLHNYLKEVKQNSWRRISQSEIRNSAAAEKSDALRAAESVGKISESLILVRLFDEIRTYFACPPKPEGRRRERN